MAHTNLKRARKVCVYVKVGIIVAVIEEMFAGNRQASQASVGSASAWGAGARGAMLPYVHTSRVRPSILLN